MIDVKSNTLDEEVDYICGLLTRMEKFIAFGYELSLPDTPEMKGIISKSCSENPRNNVCEDVRMEIYKIYNEGSYCDAKDSVERYLEVIKRCIPTFKQYEKAWGFKIFKRYTIRITAFGPGGSYDSDTGNIVMKKYKCFAHPDETAVHEIVHIGIEKVIIEKFDIPHRIKERIVDKFMVHHFKELIPSYEMRDIGDSIIDEYLDYEDSWIRLPYYIGKFKEKFC